MTEIHWVSLSFLLVIAGFVLHYRKQFFNRLRLYRWRKALKIKEHRIVFETLYNPVNGYWLSKKARQNNDRPELVYGEITFESFIALLSLCKINRATRFVDLGSGTGKAVIAAAMIYPLKKAVGIEILESLHRCAHAQKTKLIHLKQYAHLIPRIQFINADFLNYDLREADLIFINATAFFGEPWKSIIHHLHHLKEGAQCISISKQLPLTDFKLDHTARIEMSWGVVFAYIHSKIPSS